MPDETTPPTLLLSTGWRETEAAVRQAGFGGYLGSESSPEELHQALADLRKGQVHYSQREINGLLDQRVIPTLTQRQVEVIRLVGMSRTDAKIASLLGVSERAVRHHIYVLFQKLGMERRGEIIALAVLGGLTRVMKI